MDKRLKLTKEQIASLENLSDAIAKCKKKGIEFISDDGIVFYAFNAKKADAVQSYQGEENLWAKVVMPRYDLMSIYFPQCRIPFNDEKFEVMMK